MYFYFVYYVKIWILSYVFLKLENIYFVSFEKGNLKIVKNIKIVNINKLFNYKKNF